MNAKRLYTNLVLLIVLFSASACAAKEKTTVKQIPAPNSDSKIVSQGVLAPVAAATQPPVITRQQGVMATSVQQPKDATAAGQAQTNEQTAPSSDVAMLNYQTGGVRMVIKDAEIELLVENTERAIDQVTQLAADYNGYLISSQTWYDGEFKYAAIRLAVPSGDFETALTNLRHIGLRVSRETGSGQDVSAEYTDLQSRLTNLEATAARVREFLNAAQTVDESLKVNQQLSDLEAQIEQIKGQMKYYEGRSAYSTLTVYLTPERPTPTPAPTATSTPSPTPTATSTPRPGWNPSNTFQDASSVLSALFRATVDVLIWLTVVFGPFLLALVIILWVVDHFFHLRARMRVSRSPLGGLPPAVKNTENHTIEK